MIFHAGVLLLLMALAFLLQELTPSVVSLLEAMVGGGEHDFLHRARVMFLPAFFFSALLTIPFPAMLAMAFACGFLWDAANALIWGEGSPGFGTGPLLFGLFGGIMHGARELYLRGRWVGPTLLSGACVFFLLLTEYLWINFRAGDFSFPGGFWIKIGMSSLLTTVCFPVFLLLADRSLRAHGGLIRERGFGSR